MTDVILVGVDRSLGGQQVERRQALIIGRIDAAAILTVSLDVAGRQFCTILILSEQRTYIRARALDVDGPYAARILKLATLAPDIVHAILNGEEPDGMSLAKLTQSFPED